MKNLFSKLVIIIFLLFSFTRCVKDVVTPNTVEPVTDPQNLSELKASANFDWSTTRKINIDIKGLSVEGTQLKLQIIDADGHVIFQKQQKANENFKTDIEIPSYQEFVTIVYGDAIQLYDCTSGTVSVIINQ